MALSNIVPTGTTLIDTGFGYSYYNDPNKGRVLYFTDPQKTLETVTPEFAYHEFGQDFPEIGKIWPLRQKYIEEVMAPWLQGVSQKTSVPVPGRVNPVTGKPLEWQVVPSFDWQDITTALSRNSAPTINPSSALARGTLTPYDLSAPFDLGKASGLLAKARTENQGGTPGWMGPVAGGIGAIIGGPVLGGALGGMVGGTSGSTSESMSDVLASMGKSGAKGGAIGWAGGQLAKGLEGAVGYNPVIADATWGSTATPISQLGVQAGTNAATGILKNTITQALNPNRPSVSGNTPVGNTNNFSGGSMATTDQAGGMNLQDLYNLLMTGGTALNTASQRRSLDVNNQQAVNQIMAPTPDQAQYRQQLSTLMQDPGSITSSPVYQFASEQGQSALERVLNARGMRGSGNELYEMQKFGQGLAGQQFYNQANLLAGLSGIPQDTARSLAAGQQVRQGGLTNAAMQGQILGDIGLGTQQILGQGQGGGGLGTTTIASLLKQAGDWFSPTDNTIQDWSSPVFENNYSWNNLDSFFNTTANVDQFTPDYLGSFASDQSTFLQDLMNPSYSFGW